jgi:hypothetical protein
MTQERPNQYGESLRPESHWALDQGYDEETIRTVVGRGGRFGQLGYLAAVLEAQFGPEMAEVTGAVTPYLDQDGDPPSLTSYIKAYADAVSETARSSNTSPSMELTNSAEASALEASSVLELPPIDEAQR